MEAQTKIPHDIYIRHIRRKEWNEYVIEYYALRMEKRTDKDYLRIQIWQGQLLIYQDLNFASYSMTPAHMHEKLYDFLKRYISVIKTFGIVYEDAKFKPPELSS